MTLLLLFYEFFKVGLFSVGGGLATLPFLYDISDKTGWFTHGDITNLIAVSESTPGPIGVNAATYVGYLTAGLPGAVTATVGLITPSILVILLVSQVLERFRTNRLVEDLFYGLRPASTGLIAAAGFLVMQSVFLTGNTVRFFAMFQWTQIIFAVILFVAIEKFDKHPAFYIAISAAVGIMLHLSR